MEDTLRDLEYTLAFHGAPALAGIKPADLVAWGSPQVCMGTLLEDYRRQLSRCGIQLRLLCSCRPRCLILVYRPERLAAQLARPRVRALLAREGYPVDRGLEEMLDALQLRLTCGAFPHEIGLFLGYPPEDVEGFRLHRGRDYKLCGCWKVYSDVEGARQCFRRYDRCRAALCRRVRAGGSLPQMFRAA